MNYLNQLTLNYVPLNGLQPLLELSTAIGRYLERSPCRTNNTDEVLVIVGRQVVEPLVHALYVHLLTFLYQWSQCCPEMLHEQAGIVPGQVLGRFYCNIIEDKRTHNGIYSINAELMEIVIT